MGRTHIGLSLGMSATLVLLCSGTSRDAAAETLRGVEQRRGQAQIGLRDGEVVRGEARIAEMRRLGQLPDSFKRNGCRYDLAGDPAAAYYVKTCP